MQLMRALVTGASGFVGSALCRALALAGHSAVALTRDPEQARARVGPECSVEQGSIADPTTVARAARGCEVVFHAAGIATQDAPARVLRWVNVAGTENVLRAARHARVRRVVHISCADVSLVDEDRMHWDEQRALPSKPLGPHAQTKLMAEELALAESDDTLEVTALRPALLWGRDDVDGLARLIRESRSGAFTLYGGGRNVVATTHVDNLANAALLAAGAPLAPARAYYVSDGEFLEAREFYTRLFSAIGVPPPKLGSALPLALAKAAAAELFRPTQGAARARIVRRGRSALFDVSRATHDLALEAKIDLEARLAELGAWVRELGGPDALLTRARPEPSERDVDEQVRAAGGD
jgi:2-alkyl-3-oxoalkanoate reductase